MKQNPSICAMISHTKRLRNVKINWIQPKLEAFYIVLLETMEPK